MKLTGKIALAAALAIAAWQSPAFGADNSAFPDEKSKMSYAIGLNIGNNIKRGKVELDIDVMSSAMKDVLAGKEAKLNDQQVREAIMAYNQQTMTKREEERKQLAEKNRKEGEAFLAENKKKPDVKVHEVTLQDGSKAELQYKVIKEGTGAKPGSNDMVTVNYRGTLINGKEFDSSAKHGKPAQFHVKGVVRGWTEALQMMKEGAKWEVYLPPTLAYGDNGSGAIEPGSTLIFEVELVSTATPPPPTPPQPLTSDIIKVPSADEIKKGAKIEVLKPEDVERMTKTNKAAEASPKK